MRIVVDNGAYTLRNLGDISMLQTTVQRIRQWHPDARVMVLTSRPDLLQRYCPGTLPLSVQSRDNAYFPEEADCRQWRKACRRIRSRWRRLRGGSDGFQDYLCEADAVVVAGGGFLNDLNPAQTRAVLRMLADAAERGKRIALFSQGLGPLESADLLGLLKGVCCTGAPVGLRESCHGPKIARRAGAKPGQIAITGDDAVEMVWAASQPGCGEAIGFSVRQAVYSGVNSDLLLCVAEALQRLRLRHQARLTPLPISFNDYEDDPRVVTEITGRVQAGHHLEDPAALIRAASECRIIVTGTYHAAVFGLAQGIPCVCFYASPYYRSKMEGLARQFPGGCHLVDLCSPEAGRQIELGADRLWERAEHLDPVLQRLAGEQTAAGRLFYEQVLSS